MADNVFGILEILRHCVGFPPSHCPFPLTCSVSAALAKQLLCPDNVNRHRCAINTLRQTRHIQITSFKISLAVYHRLGSAVVGRGPTFGIRPLFPCCVSRLHNRCLIRGEQGGAKTG